MIKSCALRIEVFEITPSIYRFSIVCERMLFFTLFASEFAVNNILNHRKNFRYEEEASLEAKAIGILPFAEGLNRAGKIS